MYKFSCARSSSICGTSKPCHLRRAEPCHLLVSLATFVPSLGVENFCIMAYAHCACYGYVGSFGCWHGSAFMITDVMSSHHGQDTQDIDLVLFFVVIFRSRFQIFILTRSHSYFLTGAHYGHRQSFAVFQAVDVNC